MSHAELAIIISCLSLLLSAATLVLRFLRMRR